MYFYENKPCLYYHDKKHIQSACEWFWNSKSVNMSASQMANFLKNVYGYEDLIIIMAYTLFLERIKPLEINFRELIERKIFINPFLSPLDIQLLMCYNYLC